MTALEGIRVVEVGLLVQGPQAAATLGMLGADVIKVELPMIGDQARWLPTAPLAGEFRSSFFVACNRGKRSVALDLRKDEGRDAFLRLIETSDVLITNFMPGTMEGWGLGFDTLSSRNPGLVYAAGSAFGHLGQDAARAGADLSAQASGGLIMTTGTDGDEPTPVAATIADHIASQNIVSGVLAALVARGRTGRGQRVDVSLLGSQIWAQASEYTAYLLTSAVPGRSNKSHPLIGAIYGIFPTADGWIAIVGVAGPQRSVFYEVIGRADLDADPRFASPLLTESQKAELFPIIAEAFRTKSTSDWCAALGAAELRYAPVRDYAEVVADPQTWDNGYFVVRPDASGADMRVVGSPIAMSESPPRIDAIVPDLGAHTDEVLRSLGFSNDEIDALRAAGAC